MQHLAYHDSLTNLPNRALLLDRLTQQIALLKRHDLRGALMFSTSITSNTSMTHSAIRSVMPCSSWSPLVWRPACARKTPWRGWVVTNLSC